MMFIPDITTAVVAMILVARGDQPEVPDLTILDHRALAPLLCLAK